MVQKINLLARLIIVVLILAAPQAVFADQATVNRLTPAAGQILHGVYPGGQTGEEDDITPADVDAYEHAVGHRVAWVYFSNNWYKNRAFPAQTARWIRNRGATPYIRLMLRSDSEQNHREPVFTLQAIARGDFDTDLTAWGQAAARFNTPLIAEFGTEMNGEWFPWNARWNGQQRGADRFVAAYRHIIDITRAAGANNILWVFHVNNDDHPARRWNRLEAYYPGASYIDWLAVSVYSTQGPDERDRTDFTASMDRIMARLAQMAPNKPVILAEFGTDVYNRHEIASQWADGALTAMISNRWPALIGFSWWNETWENDDIASHDTDMRVQSNAELASVFTRHLSNRRVRHHP